MDYDPIKDRLGRLFNRSHPTQRLFYRILDLVFLRAWYVQRELRRIISSLPVNREIDVLDAGTGERVRRAGSVAHDEMVREDDGVDRSQIDARLALSPADRVRTMARDAGRLAAIRGRARP